jgi:hypothetical protein
MQLATEPRVLKNLEMLPCALVVVSSKAEKVAKVMAIVWQPLSPE